MVPLLLWSLRGFIVVAIMGERLSSMRNILNVTLLFGVAGLVAGCVTHVFAPGPGMSALDFEPQSAQCRLLARGADPSFSFGASGSPKFVAASMAGAAVGAAVGTAIRENENFNDCMEARGWRVVDGVKPASAGPGISSISPSPDVAVVPETMTAPASEPLPVRRALGITVSEVAKSLTYSSRIDPPRGLIIMSTEQIGAASAAGLRRGDVILTFENRTLMSPTDLQIALRSTAPRSIVPMRIWRDNEEMEIPVQF